MNGLYDLMVIYAGAILVSPIIIILCINTILGELINTGKENPLKLDMTGKSYFGILVLVILGYII